MKDKRFKPHNWDNPNKMHIESEFVTFNRQCELISTGNVFATCQVSSYVRPWGELDNYGYKMKPGEGLNYDMQFFEKEYGSAIRDIIYDPNRTESVILYQIRVWKKKEQEVIGYILTDKDYHLLAQKVCWKPGTSMNKPWSAMEEVKNYVVAGYWESHKEDAA